MKLGESDRAVWELWQKAQADLDQMSALMQQLAPMTAQFPALKMGKRRAQEMQQRVRRFECHIELLEHEMKQRAS
jgi:hypothetical protein